MKKRSLSRNSLVVFRVDGGATLGMGHLLKTEILIRKLKEKTRRLSFLIFIKQEKEGIRWLRAKKLPVRIIPSHLKRSEEPEWILKRIFPLRTSMAGS